MIEGILLIDKPEGWTSFDVVAKVRRIVTDKKRLTHISRGFCTEGQEPDPGCEIICKCRMKVGHSGTLDPAATGLLVIAVGKYTKRIPELIKQDKTYEVTMCLGKTSTTGDKEGEITDVSDIQPTKEQIQLALSKFMGDIMQTPPAFSAIKVNGQRAYDLARKGKEVKLEPRPAKIYTNEFTSYEYPYVKFTSKVGSGTYIRSLVEDIGKELGTGAYMSDLRRTQIGNFEIKDAVGIEAIENSNISEHLVTLDN